MGLIPYAVQLATPNVAHALHEVGRRYDILPQWQSQSQTLVAAPREGELCNEAASADVFGRAYLGQHVHRIDTHGAQPDRNVGRVELTVQVHVRFGITHGAYGSDGATKCLYFWAKQYQTGRGTEILVRETAAGLLAFAVNRKSHSMLALEIAEGLQPTGNDVVVKSPLFWFADSDDRKRFVNERRPFDGLCSRDTTGRAWMTEVKFSVTGGLRDNLMRHNDRIMQRPFYELELVGREGAAWLPDGLDGPVLSLPSLQVGDS